MAVEFTKKDWHFVGTGHGNRQIDLNKLADAHPGQVTVERLEVTEPDQITALRDRLSDNGFDILFVNAGNANHDQSETIAETSTDEFVRIMLTNALGVMLTVDAPNRPRCSGHLVHDPCVA